MHTRDFVAPEEFLGRRVLVVGGGTSAAQFLLQFADLGIDTLWSTRREPQWRTAPKDKSWGIGVEAEVNDRTHSGLPPRSVVSVTGLPLTDFYTAGIESGVLVSRGGIAGIRRALGALRRRQRRGDRRGPLGHRVPRLA